MAAKVGNRLRIRGFHAAFCSRAVGRLRFQTDGVLLVFGPMGKVRLRRSIGVAAAGALALALLTIHWPVPGARDQRAIAVASFGENSGRGFILIEPALSARDYKTAKALEANLARYLDVARDNGWLSADSVVVFPEHIGTWLVAANAPALAYRAKTISTASIALILDEPIAFGMAYSTSREKDRAAAALFRARGERMARDYQAVFSALARAYGVTIVAGSIALENPVIAKGEVEPRDGAIYNVSAVFKPDGSLHPSLVHKRYPIPGELAFAAPGAQPTPVFDTPAGRLGVLICADSWHPDIYSELAAKKVDIIAVPAFLQGSGGWSKPWGGYVTPAPDDLDRRDIGRLSEGEAWVKYSLPGRIGASGATAGATAFLRGGLWDLGADGRTLAAAPSGAFVGERFDGGAVTVIWR